MSKENEIMQAVADLSKAMAILKEKQEAIEQKLESMGPVTVSVEEINKAFDRNKGWATITGPLDLTNFSAPPKTSVRVTIEDLQLLKNWMSVNIGDDKPVMSPYEFFKKYLP